MAFQDEDGAGGKMSDEDFETYSRMTIMPEHCLDRVLNETKRAREAEKRLEQSIKTIYNAVRKDYEEIIRENAELRDALTMIAAKALDLMGEKR